jgi:hypothetical protein
LGQGREFQEQGIQKAVFLPCEVMGSMKSGAGKFLERNRFIVHVDLLFNPVEPQVIGDNPAIDVVGFRKFRVSFFEIIDLFGVQNMDFGFEATDVGILF